MAISENTLSARTKEVQSLQQSWVVFQNDIKNRLFEQQAQQDKVNNTLNELITGLS